MTANKPPMFHKSEANTKFNASTLYFALHPQLVSDERPDVKQPTALIINLKYVVNC